ncbi:BCCT family transporter [Shimia abyssi]|uniref:BCCT family transporter n=1 Tax=Shimia abyssi TaxID=1662395 RepID=UPI002435CCE7|nr:BCCT family transporter [Shimia abyssi]
MITALVLIMGLSKLSADSEVGRGVKYRSNLNTVSSLILPGTFLALGSVVFAATTHTQVLADDLLHFFEILFAAHETGTPLGDWQKGWTTFYWAWQDAFAPSVGLLLARISRRRSVRGFVLGTVVARR